MQRAPSFTCKKKARPSVRKSKRANVAPRHNFILTAFQKELIFGLALIAVSLLIFQALGALYFAGIIGSDGLIGF